VKLLAASGSIAARKTDVFAAVETLAAELPLEEIPDLVGQLARAQAVTALRLSQAASGSKTEPDRPLLTVEELAAKLRISEQNVYARAKTDLRSAAVDVGSGQLRFDADRINRFVEARRRS